LKVSAGACFLTLVLIPYFMAFGPSLVDGMIWLLPPEPVDPARAAAHRARAKANIVGIAIVVAVTAVAA